MDIISQDLNFEPPESREEFEKKFFNFKIDGFERVFCRIENYISFFLFFKITPNVSTRVSALESFVNRSEFKLIPQQ